MEERRTAYFTCSKARYSYSLLTPCTQRRDDLWGKRKAREEKKSRRARGRHRVGEKRNDSVQRVRKKKAHIVCIKRTRSRGHSWKRDVTSQHQPYVTAQPMAYTSHVSYSQLMMEASLRVDSSLSCRSSSASFLREGARGTSTPRGQIAEILYNKRKSFTFASKREGVCSGEKLATTLRSYVASEKDNWN
ncbi:hypothetical protein AOLI_G00142170 [Acnodon oligacanthus]